MKYISSFLSINLTIICIILSTNTSMSQIGGNALELDGYDDYVFCGNDPSLQVNQYTITAWVHPYSYNGPLPDEHRMEILEKSAEYWLNISTITQGPDARKRRDRGEVRIGGYFGPENGHYYVDSEYVVPLNEWTHVASVYDFDSLKLYINGEYETAVKIPFDYSSRQTDYNYLAIGAKVSGANKKVEAQFHGKLDELCILDTALSIIDLQELIKSGINDLDPNWNRVVAYYKFDEDRVGYNDGLATDEIGLNNGTNNGAYWVSNTVTSIEESPTFAQQFELQQNYPNPFNQVTNIRFIMPHSDFVQLNIYNLNGKLAERLVSGRMNKGEHIVQWDASNLPSGTYFYKIESANRSQTKQCVLIK